jgi:hypothetical protein
MARRRQEVAGSIVTLEARLDELLDQLSPR